MWILIYLAIFLLPLGLMGLVFLMVGATGVKIFKTGKRTYVDIKPYLDHLVANGKNVQQKGLQFADRATALAGTFEELGGRWAFVSQTLARTQKSPVITAANVAGRVSAGYSARKEAKEATVTYDLETGEIPGMTPDETSTAEQEND
jgi:hypothetical protein